MVARYKGHRSELDVAFAICLGLHRMLLAIRLAIERHIAVGGEPTTGKVCQFEMWKQMFDTRSATFVLAKMGSGTITTATLLSPATSARYCSSPFAGLKVKSMGSSL
jgi:hypothetical protein